MKERSRACCEQHLDMAFDDFLLESETFPHLEECDEKKCDYCNNRSKYELRLPKEEISG